MKIQSDRKFKLKTQYPGSVLSLAMFFIFCHHWTVWPAFDSVDCGGHHAISCQTCWIENANGKGPTYDPALYRDFYVSWKLIITHLRLGTHKFVRVF